ncbi:TatD family hydrolase [Bacillus sp. ISL-47]|uniref:TatD family hydrolase n=1 Tax=Bacillus sp. ISL-47 TaxID=2819130 RepID=UPI001BEB9C49|nr:TatD family hydrolase [Bacillus sp. ISL-47]MBT2690403.1 TatD family hydrolase [Bacillus sp. ISL-47]MBT2707486.1 TatD family hydrolase [Pseudomonas sp. ISL-84]
MDKIVDAHIHLDKYSDEEIKEIFKDSPFQLSVITVSFDLESCKRNLLLSNEYPNVKPAFGFHPEQDLPNDQELSDLFKWMETHKDQMIAVGEVGLPYYLRKKHARDTFQIEGYLVLLEEFIKFAKQWNKPIALHAVYDDAPIVCTLLEKHSVQKAHFHWFKGDQATVSRLISNGYYISFTPDIVYEKEIQELVRTYPLKRMMAETDGPWPFEGPFKSQPTHPAMMQHSIRILADIKKKPSLGSVYKQLFENTKSFYNI